MPPARANAMDHMVLVLFENRSFDNLLGRLYAPGEVESFEGVVGKDLSNPVPDWAVHGAEGGVVPYGISVGMDVPDPDPGEEYPHTNTQLFNILDDVNRCKDATEMVAPYNAPPDGRSADNGRVRHRLHQLPHRRARPAAHLRGVQPDHDWLHARTGAGH